MFDAGRNGRTIVRREKARAGLGNILHQPPTFPEFPNLLVMALRWRRRRAGRRVAQVPRFLMSRMELIRGKLPSCQS